ncbi:MAG: hypothetical protein HQM16_10880 [Deltaproteobacteria bacterium]|nr:hypothetical protein [Deltaproteobacteria bacterium]
MNHSIKYWSLILFIGTLWGFFEATLGGVLHALQIPIAGKVMAPIGFAILFWGYKNSLKPHHMVLVSLIAASLKFCDVFLFALPFLHVKIINPAQSIILQALCFAAATRFFRNFDQSLKGMLVTSLTIFTVSFLSSALLSYVAFDYTMGSLSVGLAATLFHLAIGSTLTFAGLTLMARVFTQGGLLNLNGVSLPTRATLSLLFIILTLVMRASFV